MDNKNVILVLFFLLLVFEASAQQHQLVVLKNETVLARYRVGDMISFARAGDKKMLRQRILDLNDTLIMMNLDSLPYYRIKKLDIRGRKSSTFGQRLGAYMIASGILLPVAELVNTGLVQNQKASVDEGVALASGVLLAGGAALVLIKKPYFKPGRKHRLRIVRKDSVFYEDAAPARSANPYLPGN